MNNYIKYIIEAFDFNNVSKENKTEKILKDVKNYILTDTCDKIRNVFIQKIHDIYYDMYPDKTFYNTQMKDIKNTLEKYCFDSEVVIDGKTLPALEYHHPVLVGKNWLLGSWYEIETEKFRKCKANEDKIYYKKMPKEVQKFWSNIIRDMSFVCLRVSTDFSLMAGIYLPKKGRGAIYQIFLTGYKKYMPDGKEIN